MNSPIVVDVVTLLRIVAAVVRAAEFLAVTILRLDAHFVGILVIRLFVCLSLKERGLVTVWNNIAVGTLRADLRYVGTLV